MQQHLCNIPDQDLAYFEEGSEYFGDYVKAVGWGQKFAKTNREIMMQHVMMLCARSSPNLFRRIWKP
jgi:tRNA-splicing ligase RtcB